MRSLRGSFVRRGLLVGPALAALVVGLAGGAAARPSATGDLITYQGNGKIYAINTDGTDRQVLVSGATDDTFDWSPDARWIAFTAGSAHPWLPGSTTEIKIAAADGTHVRTLTRAPSHTAGSPTWSPDGRRIAFDAYSRQYDRQSIYVINADGTGLRLLTRGAADDGAPDWSPDGRWIAFDRYGPGETRSAVMAIRPDGTGLHRIATPITGPQCACPVWSPDSSKLVYQASASVATKKFPEIYVMNADGSGQTRLTRDPARDENPDWSPDGTRIAFYSERVGNAEIYVMNADGTNVTRVTHDPWYSALPRWRPLPHATG